MTQYFQISLTQSKANMTLIATAKRETSRAGTNVECTLRATERDERFGFVSWHMGACSAPAPCAGEVGAELAADWGALDIEVDV